MTKRQCRQCILLMTGPAQLVVGRRLNRVAVDEKKLLLVLEDRSHLADAAAGPEDLLLEREVKLDLRAVFGLKIFLDRFRQVVEVYDDLVNAGTDESLDRIADQ